MLNALRRFRVHLYGVRFTVETDANTLVAQLNRTATDLPGSLMTRWLAWISLWDFNVRHVPGVKNGAADGLSRRVPPEGAVTEEPEDDIDDFIDNELDTIRLQPVEVLEEDESRTPLLQDGRYSEGSHEIARWLATLRRPKDMDAKRFRKFKKNALKYIVRDGHLFRRAGRNRPLRRVIDDDEDRQKILHSLHEESGHRGAEGTYNKISWRYYWPRLYHDAVVHVKSCPECQLRSTQRLQEELVSTSASFLQQRWSLDVVKIPGGGRFQHIIVARNYLSGWPEARAEIGAPTAKRIARFLWEEVITRHGIFNQLTADGGTENNNEIVDALADLYRIKKVTISPYNAQANGLIEAGHMPIVHELSKLTNGTGKNFERWLHAVLWADRTTVKRTTGRTPAWVHGGEEHVLPIELELPTWQTLPWNEVKETGDLLALRARQLDARDVDIREAVARTRRIREEGKEYWDDRHVTRQEPLKPGDLVMKWDNVIARTIGAKMAFRWKGPFRVREVMQQSGSVILEELDGALIKGTVHGKDLKLFIQRRLADVPVEHQESMQPQEHAEDPFPDDADAPPTPMVEVPALPGGRTHTDYEAFGDEVGNDVIPEDV